MSSASTDHGSDGNAAAIAARGKRPVWNMPSNGSIEVGPVMGAVSWPALSESTKASPKSSSSDSLKSLSDGSASAPPGPLMSSPSAKPTTSYPNPNSTLNPTAPTRQKSMKRGSGSGSGSSSSSSSTPANGGVAPPSPPLISTEIAQITLDKQAFPESSPKGLSNKKNDHGSSKGAGFMPQSHSGADYQRGYGSNRRGNNGGGSHHNNYGNRRDQDWTHHRSVHMQQQQQRGGVRPYPRRLPPVSASFIGPPLQVQPFVGNPMGFPDLPSPVYYLAPHPPPESLRGVPFVAHPAPHAMFFPALDPQRAQLLKQIDYYFSNENLCKDIFLRQNMDDQGWVPISLIAGFNRVKLLTNNIPYILDVVRLSTVVEVQGERIRRRNDWINWVLPSNHFGTAAGSQSSATPDYDAIAARLQTVGLEGATTEHNSMGGSIHTDFVLTRSASGNLNNQFQVVEDPSGDGNGNGQFTSFTDSDRSKSVRSLARSDTL